MGDDIGVRVSYVIPNYQGEKLLPACLDSVFAQTTREPREVIVVDDGSDDGSLDLISNKYPQVRLIVNKVNRGPAAAKNIGAREAKGEFIAFLDNDVELEPTWTEEIMAGLREDGNSGACASHLLLDGDASVLNSTGGLINLLGYAWDRGIFSLNTDAYYFNTRVMYACSAAMMVKREVFEEVGGFDERFRYLYEDADLGWRVNISGYGVSYEPKAVAYHRLSSTMGQRWMRNLYLYERNRLCACLKNMELGTLKWVRREISYRFAHKVHKEMNNGVKASKKFSLLLRMSQALGWNLFHLPGTLRRRREVGRKRERTDQQLVSMGVLCPLIGDPPIGEDPRLQRDGRQAAEDQRSLPRKVVMARDRYGFQGSGWYGIEVDARGVAYRWTGDRATMLMRGGGKKNLITVRTVMAHPDDLSRVSLKVNGRPVSTFEVPNHAHLQKIPVPGDIEHGPWEVELEVLNPFRPRETLGIEDQRLLGVAVAAVEVR